MEHAIHTPASGVQLTTDVDYQNVPCAQFQAACAMSRYAHTSRKRIKFAQNWGRETIQEHGLTLLCTYADYDGEFVALIEFEACLVYVRVERNRDAYVSVAASSPAEAARVSEHLKSCLHDASDEDTEHSASIYFWSKQGNGYNYTQRTIDVDPWDSIATNYCAGVADELRRLTRIADTDVGGLALWYGPPGTGKTTAVRALAGAWREWCDIHVVIDPERLLSDPGYLIKVISHEACDCSNTECANRKRSRLVVLEDAGELIAIDARVETGQALSRILNVTDGLLGRGLKTSVLITTNEEIGRLHPAIRRPGRCWSQLRFDSLAAHEANAWLQAHDVDATVNSARTVAELYALRRGEEVTTESPVGFTM